MTLSEAEAVAEGYRERVNEEFEREILSVRAMMMHLSNAFSKKPKKLESVWPLELDKVRNGAKTERKNLPLDIVKSILFHTFKDKIKK